MAREHRLDPRVPAHFPVTVTLANNIQLTLAMDNISTSGVMLHASQQDFQTILANNKGLQLQEPVEAVLSFELPGKRSPSIQLKLPCRAIYVRRQSQNKYFMGFKYIRLPARAQSVIRNYVNHKLAPSLHGVAKSP